VSSRLIGILFDDATEAARLKTEVQQLQTDGLLKLEEAAVVVRDAEGKVSCDTGSHLLGGGVAWGSLWGLLLGSILMMPVAAVAVGAAAGALTGYVAKVGLAKSFKQRLNDGLRPNTSALLLCVANVNQADEVLTRIKAFVEAEKLGGQIVSTNLSPEAAQAVQAALKV